MELKYWTFPHLAGKWFVKDSHTLVSGDANKRILKVMRWEGNIPVVFGADAPSYVLHEIRGSMWNADEATVKQPVQEPVDPWTTQVGGDHYCKLKIQPFMYSMANGLDPMQHTIVKYVTRFRDKAGIQDLKKAKQTIDLLIAYEQSKENKTCK